MSDKQYNPKTIEPKWQKVWADTGIYKAVDFDERQKYVMLTEFPYPSGDGLHSGHAREYTIGDVMARYKRMQGYNVLYPMGYDAFGLPTENYAIKTGVSPQEATASNTANFRRQFDSLGYSIDWDRQVNTTDPAYYKWTQWLFLQFHKAGLAYQAEMAINWCPKEKTGLANEEVVNGLHERCGTPVEKKLLNQWMLGITKYADRLIEGLKDVDYPDRISSQQINWIGKSVGAEIDFAVDLPAARSTSSDLPRAASPDADQQASGTQKITVFTTRPDTLFGATFMVLAPEHELVASITSDDQRSAVEEYVARAKAKSDLERQENKEKTGVFTGAYAINPANNQKIPIWIADYVLMGYGTGAIMAVPAHDERDYEFAKRFEIPIMQVIDPGYPDTLNPPKPGVEFTERTIVQVVVVHPDGEKIIILEHRQPNNAKYSFVVGGIEDGEDGLEAAVREVAEETGYKNVKRAYELDYRYSGKFWHPLKQLNRHAHFVNVVVELADTERDEIAPEEVAKHNVHWVELSKADEYMLWPVTQEVLDRYRGGGHAITDPGVLMNSGEFDGLSSAEARDKMTAKFGREKVQYKMRDWVFSRQHYWGEPIPIIHCATCGVVPVPEDQLPVELPVVTQYEPTEDGKSPLAAVEEWVHVSCPKCDGPAKRETDTMPNWAGSSWYYLRYFDANNDQAFADPEKLKYWGAVDMYLGGMEHTTLHLLYSRFWHQFFYDQGLVPTPEPYAARRGQGIVLAADGRKMSKSLGNVINPTDVIERVGADALRLYILFMAPYDESTAWSDEHLAGVSRFLYRAWAVLQKPVDEAADSLEVDRLMHKTIKKVTEHLDNMRFNTAVSALMECVNGLGKQTALTPTVARQLTMLLAPFAPHLAEEIWEQLGETESVHIAGWPTFDAELVKDDVFEMAIQVNGKLRGTMLAEAAATEDELKAQAAAVESVAKYLAEGELIKTIVVPGRMVSFVVR